MERGKARESGGWLLVTVGGLSLGIMPGICIGIISVSLTMAQLL